MKQPTIKSLLAVLATPLLLVSCNVETSDNGPLDGFWHLERVDTLATGGSTDYHKGYVFWGVQKDLMYIKDSSNGSIGAYYLRFNQTHDSLHVTKIYLDHGHEDNPNHEQGGDIPVEAIDNNLRQLGINALPEHFKKEALNANRMILSTEKLRLKFKKF
ncbi:lipocalin-like domain-containing protein [Prevotella sp.]|uniref:lipocalin-like domain-containing protein n=1 Tax=uncultured Prevotella sp. TaxID=159272 RepID=UPI0027E2B515|nr:lipocalin-like domain-containing protein [uncultured Prevotella sp.]